MSQVRGARVRRRSSMLRRLGRCLARYLDQPIRRYEPLAVIPLDCVASVLRPADILLVEGKSRVSTAIKYLTQSTWSHAALFVGDFRETGLGLEAPTLIEADLEHGVVAAPIALARQRKSDAGDLLHAHRAGIPVRPLSDLAARRADRRQPPHSGCPRGPARAPSQSLHTSRLRHLAVFRDPETGSRVRFRLPCH